MFSAQTRAASNGPRRPRALAGLVAVLLTLTIGGAFAHRFLGLQLTLDGVVLAKPLGQPPELVGSGDHEFAMTQRDGLRPVSYDPCRAVEFVVNDAAAPPGSEAIVADAVAAVSTATGLVFRDRGGTDQVPTQGPMFLTPQREPVVIAWTTPDEVPDLAGPVAGIGGSTAKQHYLSGELEYVTGLVALDAPELAKVMTRSEGAAQVRAVVMHEIAHVVGLDHVSNPFELMYDGDATVLDFGPGDREGLAKLGSGRCYP